MAAAACGPSSGCATKAWSKPRISPAAYISGLCKLIRQFRPTKLKARRGAGGEPASNKEGSAMRHLPLVAGGVLAAFVSTSAVAQSFIESLVAVYNNSPALEAQRAALRAVDEGVPQALSNWRPSLSFSSEYGYREQTTSGRSTSNSDGVLHPFTNSLTLSQP